MPVEGTEPGYEASYIVSNALIQEEIVTSVLHSLLVRMERQLSCQVHNN